MEGSVGKALRDARLQQKLTIEEVSRGTKIRPARIVDLENDDYMHFPNLAYARSFLVLYAKYLRVDITKYPTVEVGSAVGTGDYQYLRSDEVETPARVHHHHEQAGPPEKPRWLIAFFVFVVMVVLGVIAGFFIMQFMRLGSMETLVKKDMEVYKAPAVSPTPGSEATPSPSATATPTASPSGEPVAVAIPVEPSAEGTPVLPAEPVYTPIPEVTPEVRKAETVITGSSDAEILAQAAAEAAAAATPGSSPEASPSPDPALAGPDREIKIKVTRKIKIRLVRENPASASLAPDKSSLYLGSVNPLQPPLVFKGKHFWLKTSDPDALKITIDGKPVTATGPDAVVEIQ